MAAPTSPSAGHRPTLHGEEPVIVTTESNHIRLDVRIRNTGTGTVNITRAVLHVLRRTPLAALVPESASYDLLLESEYNEVIVAHVLMPGEVDRFIIRVGFTPYNSGCDFRAELLLRYNGENLATSERFFTSTFH